jgi:hypothetical protein
MKSHDREYRELTARLRSAAPTKGLEQATEAFARFPEQKAKRRRPVATVAIVAAAAFVGTATWLAAPSAEAAVLREIAGAVEEAPRVHVRAFTPEGSMHYEAWRDGEKLCYEIYGEYAGRRGFDGRRVWGLGFTRRVATVATEAPEGFGWRHGEGLDRLVQTLRGSSYTESVSLAHLEEQGMRWIAVTLHQIVEGPGISGGGPRKSLYLIDPRDRLPRLSRHYRRADDAWVETGVMTYEYPNAIEAGIFEFRPEPDMLVIDRDEFVRRLPRFVHRDLGRRRVGGQEVVLRSVFADPSGAMFVLWTGGARLGPDASVRVVASDGTVMEWGPLLNYSATTDAPRIERLKIDGLPHLGAHVPFRDGTRPRLPLKVSVPVCVPTAPYPVTDGTGRRVIYDTKEIGRAEFDVHELVWTDDWRPLMKMLGTLEENPPDIIAVPAEDER